MTATRLNKATAAKATKRFASRATLCALAACTLFVGSLAGTSWYLEKHPRPIPAAALAKVEPMCSYVTSLEVKDASGKVVSHKAEIRTAACTPREYKPFVFPLWAKIIGYVVLALVVLCGGWEALLFFV